MNTEKSSMLRKAGLINRFPSIRTGLQVLLTKRDGEIQILESSDVSGFCGVNKAARPDFIFVALSQFHEGDNFALLAKLKNNYPRTKLIVQDFVPVPGSIPHYFHAGICGYLTLNASEHELEECIDNVLNGKKYIDNEGLNLFLKAVPARVSRNLPSKKLTTRESEIANYMIRGAKTTEIAGILGRRSSTISTIKKNIYNKLDVSNIIELNAVITATYKVK